MAHIFVNNKNIPVFIPSLGITIPAAGQINVSESDYDLLREASDIHELLRDGFLNPSTGIYYSDGYIDYLDPAYTIMDVMSQIFSTIWMNGNFTNDRKLRVAISTEPHAIEHQNGGSDEVDVTDLSGVLADQQHIIPSEAVSAMGAISNSNPLNHTRYQQIEITNLPESQLQLDYATHSNSNDPTTNEKQALGSASSPNSGNPFATINDLSNYSPIVHTHPTLPTQNEKDAMTASENPSSSNEFLTKSKGDSTYADASHTHVASDVTDFDTEVSNNTSVVSNTNHKNTTSGNPHNVTKSEIGLNNVDNVQQVPLSSVGQPNGVTPLNGSGIIPSQYLPAGIDEVQEYINLAAFPSMGVAGIIYLALDTNYTYRWSGSSYVLLSPSDVNSVNGQTGIVVLDTDDVSDSSSTNKYITQSQLNDLHTHANKSQLDLVSDGDHDVRSDNPHGVTLNQIGAAPVSHTHVWGDISKSGSLLSDLNDVPTKPNDGLEYLLQEVSGVLSWVLKSSISSGGGGKRTGSIPLVYTSSSSGNWFRISDNGILTYKSPWVPPYDCKVTKVIWSNRNDGSLGQEWEVRAYSHDLSQDNVNTSTTAWYVSSLSNSNLDYSYRGARSWCYDASNDNDTMQFGTGYGFKFNRLSGSNKSNDLRVEVHYEEL